MRVSRPGHGAVLAFTSSGMAGLYNRSSNYTGSETAANLNSGNATAVTVKAKWTALTIFDLTYMQEMTPTICNNTTTPNVSATAIINSHSADKTKVPRTTLVDSRDNLVYEVSKLADGNCWMTTKNLRLHKAMTLNSSNSDLPSGTTFNMLACNTFSGSYSNAECLRGSTTLYDYWEESHGDFYNFLAATAGTGTGSSGVASGTICPKGWTIPPDGLASNKSFSNLFLNYYTGKTWETVGDEPLSFVGSSFIWGLSPQTGSNTVGNHSNNPQRGDYWEKTIWDSTHAHRLYWGSNGLYGIELEIAGYDHGMLLHDWSKTEGFTIRCVSK